MSSALFLRGLSMENNFHYVLARFARGEMVIVVDDLDRENEGDIIMLADVIELILFSSIIAGFKIW